MEWKSRYRWVLLLKSCEGPEVTAAVQGLFKRLKNRYGRYPTEFHYNGGIEACNNLLGTWMNRKGVGFITSNPYTHEQNGLPEHSIQVIIDRLCTTMLAIALPKHLWCYVISAIVDLVNYTVVIGDNLIPF